MWGKYDHIHVRACVSSGVQACMHMCERLQVETRGRHQGPSLDVLKSQTEVLPPILLNTGIAAACGHTQLFPRVLEIMLRVSLLPDTRNIFWVVGSLFITVRFELNQGPKFVLLTIFSFDALFWVVPACHTYAL